MNNPNTPNALADWSFWVGCIIVIATHVYMLFAAIPASQMMAHAITNLVAAGLIILGWSKR